MILLCRLGLHKALPSKIWNDGHFFSSCARCGTPLIRAPDESWHLVPPGQRIVWRARTRNDVVWPSHML